ncbi:hypothetical protein BD410DRAFT_807583 [Rickenella mellea]|uniref:Aminoglycoside phosphotransferase domain-containing protein n=1 Tax=Rickenella mellea TaxID=50990 RepID=A0A4Y7PPV7_9AGAM|nr:hypothetical protein BD410DRAFT_807583 [Rickenella mellea]
MERITAATPAQPYMDYMKCGPPLKLSRAVKRIVADIASVGLSHNNLYPWNVMVGPFWAVKSVIDWDDCTDITVAREYWRRAMLDECHDWDCFFLEFRDSLGEILHPNEDPHKLARKRPLIRYPLGRSIGP